MALTPDSSNNERGPQEYMESTPDSPNNERGLAELIRMGKSTRLTLRKHARPYDFYGCINGYFQLKNVDIFLTFAQNIDCGYTLEPPQ